MQAAAADEETMVGDDGPLNFGREEIDQTYIVLKQASEMAVSSSSGNVSGRRTQQQQQQPLPSSSLDQQPQQNISASDQSLGSSTGAINRTGSASVMRITTSSTQLQQTAAAAAGVSSSSRRANPNSLSVGDPSSSFLSSSSGKYVHREMASYPRVCVVGLAARFVFSPHQLYPFSSLKCVYLPNRIIILHPLQPYYITGARAM